VANPVRHIIGGSPGSPPSKEQRGDRELHEWLTVGRVRDATNGGRRDIATSIQKAKSNTPVNLNLQVGLASA